MSLNKLVISVTKKLDISKKYIHQTIQLSKITSETHPQILDVFVVQTRNCLSKNLKSKFFQLS